MKIATILPVSRIELFDIVLDSIVNQTYSIDNLLVIYDGPEDKFIQVRNRVSELNIPTKLCVQSTNVGNAASIPDRRKHIANIHNQAKQLISDADWVFSIEDDGILPLDALERLVKLVSERDNVGMATGVELGRWGMPYVGAWTVNDINDIKVITSMENKTLQEPTIVEKIDACGLYCGLIRFDCYKQHTFFVDNGLGADVNLGIFIRRLGFDNYIDWGIPLTHLTNRDGVNIAIPATSRSRVIKLTTLYNNTWQSSC